MVTLNDPLGVLQDVLLALHEAVRGKPSPAPAHAHSPAAGVEAEADLLGGLERVLQTAAVWIKVEVVAGGCAAGQNEFRHRCEG